MASDGDKPNLNILRLESAENGVGQAVRSVRQIAVGEGIQADLKKSCLADLKEFQDGDLLALRRAIE